MDCDAKACYDRIIPLVLLLEYLKAGLPSKTGVFLIKIVYNFKYFITTSFGTALFHNWHQFIAAVYDIGQGATDRPSGWVFISHVIISCYQRIVKGCRVISPSNDLIVPAYTDMFVDDKTMLHNNNEFNIPPQNLMRIVQHDDKLWGRLLWTSG
eukprot:13518604-Ditylum_brightwellii.AAC.1